MKSSAENSENIKITVKALEKALADKTIELELLKKELHFQNAEKEERAAELILANKELIHQNQEKELRAAELILANIELAYQNEEKELRASELIIANTELLYQNIEKEKRATELLIANNELLSFTYISSHDLQEPLRKILTFAACILQKDHANLSEISKHYFSRIETSASQMRQLLQGLLTLSSISTIQGKFEHVKLDKFMKELSPEIKEDIVKKGALINLTELGNAFINPIQFGLVISNLISNSLKFSRTDVVPAITIKSNTISGKDLKKSNMGFSENQNYTHITFSDNGIGFEAKYKDLIFEVFKRLHNKEDYAGIGIGLAIVKKIIRNHHGVITATGELNKGTTVDIYLPLH